MNAFGGIFVEPDHGLFTAELAAARCLHQCCGGADQAELPIPVEQWAEAELRYSVEYEDIAPDGDREVLGYSEPGNNRIVLNARHTADVLRLRFTLAHEIGHHALNHYVACDPAAPLARSARSDPVAAAHELQADRFARALLMPPTLVHRFFVQTVSEAGLSDDDIKAALGKGARAVSTWRDMLLPRACSAFQVSAPAVLYRFFELILSKSQEPFLSRTHLEAMLLP